MNQPFSDSWQDSVYGLNNYRSKACFLILWLYSIEPPLYHFVNEACRKKDTSPPTNLQLLGPFACALYHILEACEKHRPDKLGPGVLYHNPAAHCRLHARGFLCDSFVVFRGAAMHKVLVDLWSKMIGKRMYRVS